MKYLSPKSKKSVGLHKYIIAGLFMRFTDKTG
jgi:hypothetical protein